MPGFIRGPVRDVEASIAEVLGAEAALSKSTVSRVCEALRTSFTRWQQHPLDVRLPAAAKVSGSPETAMFLAEVPAQAQDEVRNAY
jgi:hypothetical protein